MPWALRFLLNVAGDVVYWESPGRTGSGVEFEMPGRDLSDVQGRGQS